MIVSLLMCTLSFEELLMACEKYLKKFLVIGAVSMGLAVSCGAIGAHAIKADLQEKVAADEMTDVERFDVTHSWDTAVRLHGAHSLGLILIGLAAGSCSSRLRCWASGLLLAGIVLFSGMIYLYVALDLTTGRTISFLMLLVPIGGISWMAGWAVLACGFYHGPSAASQLD